MTAERRWQNYVKDGRPPTGPQRRRGKHKARRAGEAYQGWVFFASLCERPPGVS